MRLKEFTKKETTYTRRNSTQAIKTSSPLTQIFNEFSKAGVLSLCLYGRRQVHVNYVIVWYEYKIENTSSSRIFTIVLWKRCEKHTKNNGIQVMNYSKHIDALLDKKQIRQP